MEEKQARAELRHARISARKVKIVIDTIRGKNAKEAIAILKYTNKADAPIVAKLVKSAMANAVNNNNMDESKLYISEIYATDGLKMKRYLPRAKGSASGMVKRCSNITVKVKMR